MYRSAREERSERIDSEDRRFRGQTSSVYLFVRRDLYAEFPFSAPLNFMTKSKYLNFLAYARTKHIECADRRKYR